MYRLVGCVKKVSLTHSPAAGNKNLQFHPQQLDSLTRNVATTKSRKKGFQVTDRSKSRTASFLHNHERYKRSTTNHTPTTAAISHRTKHKCMDDLGMAIGKEPRNDHVTACLRTTPFTPVRDQSRIQG